MLAHFTIRKTFYDTKITLTVDCDRKTADAMVTHKGLIIGEQPLRFTDCDTPDKAERALSKPVSSDYATWVEMIDATARQKYREKIAA